MNRLGFIKKIFLYITLLSSVVLIIFLVDNYKRSEALIKDEMINLGNLKIRQGDKIVNTYLNNLENITDTLAKDIRLATYLATEDPKFQTSIEDIFLELASSIDSVEAIRLVDLNNDIKIYVIGDKILSRMENYKPVNLISKDYFREISAMFSNKAKFSGFELQLLPGQKYFGNPNIRTMVTLFHNQKRIGYLIINFNAIFLREILQNTDEMSETVSLIEINNKNLHRNGIFVSHKNSLYEFADQTGNGKYFQKIYGDDVFNKIITQKEGMEEINGGRDMLFFKIINKPTDNIDLGLTIVLNSEYFLKNLEVLKISIFIFMLIFIGIVLFSAYILNKGLIGPMENITKAMKIIAGGDFKYRLTGHFPQELRPVAETVNFMNASIKKYIEDIKEKQQKIDRLNKLSYLGIVAGGIAHELNSPLNSISILSSLLKENVNDKNIEDVETIYQEAKRCSEIINSLRSLSKQHGGISFQKVDLEAVINEVTYNYKDSGITTNLPSVYYPIYGDYKLIFTVIKNLVKNSAEAVESNGRIDVEIIKNDESIILIIKDNGVGMTDDELIELPQPFKTSKNRGANMGLGLVIVYKIMDDLDAKISVQSEKNIGTVFLLEFRYYDECIDS